MKKIAFITIALAIIASTIVIYFALKSEKVLVIHPKGAIAKSELDLIIVNTSLMLTVIVPTFLVILIVAWKYRANNQKAEYSSKETYGFYKEVLLWVIPSVIVAVMSVITWKASHELDPYKPLESETKPLIIQVVALDWKWLFIYPEQNIATINFIQFPERTPIHLKLAADGSPMNSFWIPQLSGQIYCMTGMVTPLYIIADGSGIYSGKAAEINGDGYAKMTFVAKSTSEAEFNDWVIQAKQSSLDLNDQAYSQILKPSIDHPVTIYSSVENDLFETIVMKYMHPPTKKE